MPNDPVPPTAFHDWLAAFKALAEDAVWSAYGGDEKQLEALWAEGLSPGHANDALAAGLEDAANG